MLAAIWICKVRNASSCQIASKSVGPWPRYGDFSILQDGGRRHLGFLKFEIFNGRDAQLGCTALSYQISSKSLKPRLRYGYFSIFKMAAAAILDFDDRDGQEVRNASSCQTASKSVEPRPRYGDFSIFQDGGRRHLGFLKFEICNGRDAQEG